MRIELIDIGRGVAILGMVAFHANYLSLFVFDTSFVIFSDTTWKYIGFLTATLFIVLSGYVQSLGSRGKTFRVNFFRGLKRSLILGALALLISLVTYSFFPEQRISWGILHFFALASLLQVFFYRVGWWIFPISVLFFILGEFISPLRLSHNFFIPLGILSHGYYSADYYPLIPWFGYMLLGQGIEYIFRGTKIESYFSHLKFPKLEFLAFLGRNSLILYILHVPVLYFLFFLFLK